MKKILMFTVVVLTGLLFMPLTQAQDLIGTVKIAENKDSVQEGTVPKLTGENSANLTITYDAAKLKIVEQKTGELDRKTEAAWVGFIITKPESANGTNKVRINGNESDADPQGEYYFAITKEKLDKGEPIKYTCEFDWNYSETFTADQTVTIIIDPSVVTLVEKESDNVVYNGPAIAEAQKQEENKENTENSNDNTKNPNTSDTIIYSVIAITISAIGLAFTYKKLHN